MVNLNDVAVMRELDTRKMLTLTMNYPQQFREGLAIGQRAPLPEIPDPVHEVVLLGTGGGSAASASLLRSYLLDRCRVPIILVQGYNTPSYLDQNSVVFAISHSGNTAEIVNSTAQAMMRGATVVGLGAGGRLRDLLTQAGALHMEVPGGLVTRVGVGHVMMPILSLLHRWGLITCFDSEFEQAVTLMEQLAAVYGPETPLEYNHAKLLAEAMAPYIPVVYGFDEQYDAVARWIKSQLGLNSKYMSFWNSIPHLHHDEAEGWDMQPELCQRLGFLLLRDDEDETVRIQKRWVATTELLAERMGRVEVVWAAGEGRLARMLSLVMLGDFLSIYLAIRKGMDPAPVAIIDLVKQRVGE